MPNVSQDLVVTGPFYNQKGASAVLVSPGGSGSASPLGQLLGGIAQPFGGVYYVDGASGRDANAGTSPDAAFATVQHAVDLTGAECGVIFVRPGSYDEIVTISRPSGGSRALTIVGLGPQGSVGIAPSGTNDGAVINHADDVTFVNIGMAAKGTGAALTNTGSRLRLIGCKLENDDGTGMCANMTLGTVAQHSAGTHGTGSDCKLIDSEFAWAATGITITCTDYGAVTELLIQGCRFHDMDTKHITEAVGSGGSSAVTFADLEIKNCLFARDETGTEPTAYIDLNADNANNGIVTNCQFPTALNGGKNTVSTALLWVCNYHTAGISNAQPS